MAGPAGPQGSAGSVPGATPGIGPAEPPLDCALCPRLAVFRKANSLAYPAFHNAPVASFGAADARLLIVGLAPGLKGANRTGRPFTGDYAGDLLYDTLLKFGFARGTYAAEPADGLALSDAMITNAVRCVPPENKPIGAEIKTCRAFLSARIAAQTELAAIVALGRIAHESVLSALGLRRAAYPFAHGAVHAVGDGRRLYDSYHCSRYNTNTGLLSEAMFGEVFARVRADLDQT